jgi:5-methylcytosine-specific restriction endonuclease McrA
MAERNDWCLPSSVPWRIVREVVLLRDNKKCQCHKHDSSITEKELHVHHIRYPEWDLKDLVALCDKCHSKQPKQTYRKEFQKVSLDEWERLTGLIGRRRTPKIKEFRESIVDEDKRILEKD